MFESVLTKGTPPSKEITMSYEQLRIGTLEATGTGTIDVPPDLAIVRLAVVTEAPTAADASAQNAKRMREVLDAIEALPHERISTVGLSLQPIFTFDPATGASSITGYRAENSIKVEADVEEAGRLFDAGIAAGANVSSGISFRLRDDRPHREEALDRAFQQAYSDARATASSADVTLLAPQALVIEPEAQGPRMFDMARLADSGTPVQPGLITVSATVRVRFGVQTMGGLVGDQGEAEPEKK
jgi:uncharacterized protein YggE